MNGDDLVRQQQRFAQQQQPMPQTDQWSANMLLVVQSIQRLHDAFDQIFLHAKDDT